MDSLQNASTSSDSVRRKCERNKRNDEIQRSNASSYVIIMSNKRRDLIRESCKTIRRFGRISDRFPPAQWNSLNCTRGEKNYHAISYNQYKQIVIRNHDVMYNRDDWKNCKQCRCKQMCNTGSLNGAIFTTVFLASFHQFSKLRSARKNDRHAFPFHFPFDDENCSARARQ